MFLLISEFIHFGLGLLIGLVGYWIWKDKKLIWISLIVSIFIDLDHLVDYWIYLGRLDFNPVRFFAAEYFAISRKFYIIFHGYEYPFILFCLSFIFKKYRKYLLIGGAAILGHLLLDVASNGVYFLNYSLIFRIANNFSF